MAAFNRSGPTNPRDRDWLGQLRETSSSKPHITHQYKSKKQKSLNQTQKIFLLESVQQLQQRMWKDQISIKNNLRKESNCSIQPSAAQQWTLFHNQTLCLIKLNRTSLLSLSSSPHSFLRATISFFSVSLSFAFNLHVSLFCLCMPLPFLLLVN